MKNFKKIEYFIFDLDGVCYLQLSEVFGQVSKRMGEYISKKLNVSLIKAKEIQTAYFHEYNTTLNGLMLKHKVDPHEFLKYVHDIDISFLELAGKRLIINPAAVIFAECSKNIRRLIVLLFFFIMPQYSFWGRTHNLCNSSIVGSFLGRTIRNPIWVASVCHHKLFGTWGSRCFQASVE